MNERIKQLIKQATVIKFSGNGDDCGKHVFDKEKFAQLIIQECAKVAWRHTPDYEDLDYGHLIKNKILNHFGVE